MNNLSSDVKSLSLPVLMIVKMNSPKNVILENQNDNIDIRAINVVALFNINMDSNIADIVCLCQDTANVIYSEFVSLP